MMRVFEEGLTRGSLLERLQPEIDAGTLDVWRVKAVLAALGELGADDLVSRGALCAALAATKLRHVVLWTDGAPGQYRLKENYLKVADFPVRHGGVTITHYFMATANFKGPHDGAGKDARLLVRSLEKMEVRGTRAYTAKMHCLVLTKHMATPAKSTPHTPIGYHYRPDLKFDTYFWRYTTYDAADPDFNADWVVYTDRETGLWKSSELGGLTSRDYVFGGWDQHAHNLMVHRRRFPCACTVCRTYSPPYNLSSDGHGAAADTVCPYADEFGSWRVSKIQYVLARGETLDEDLRPLRSGRERTPKASTAASVKAAGDRKRNPLHALAVRLKVSIIGQVISLPFSFPLSLLPLLPAAIRAPPGRHPCTHLRPICPPCDPLLSAPLPLNHTHACTHASICLAGRRLFQFESPPLQHGGVLYRPCDWTRQGWCSAPRRKLHQVPGW